MASGSSINDEMYRRWPKGLVVDSQAGTNVVVQLFLQTKGCLFHTPPQHDDVVHPCWTNEVVGWNCGCQVVFAELPFVDWLLLSGLLSIVVAELLVANCCR